ncbi:MAG: XrtA/PEP-CTERM system-associated ATPase [Vicinamibacterales bacterium]
MYERFYELRERPFALSPDPDYLYPSRVHREALDYLRYGLESHAGFIVITGEIGSGKTTLLQTLLRGIDTQTTVGRIVNTLLEPRELLETIMIDFGLDPGGRSKPLLLRDLAQYLVDQRLAGRLVLLVIDEAQNLTPAALEELRMLSNLETEKSKLLQIALVGQPNLRDKLASPELEQLRQRITVSYHLLPLDQDETANYFNHRLRRAAVGTPMEFPRDVTDLIHGRSRGVPRIINVICDAALVFGYAEERRQIDLPLMYEVMVELEATGVLPAAGSVSVAEPAPLASNQMGANVPAAPAATDGTVLTRAQDPPIAAFASAGPRSKAVEPAALKPAATEVMRATAVAEPPAPQREPAGSVAPGLAAPAQPLPPVVPLATSEKSGLAAAASPSAPTVNAAGPTPVAPRAAEPFPAVTVARGAAALDGRTKALDQREQMILQRERELAEQRRVLAEEYRLLRVQRSATPAPAIGPSERVRLSVPHPAPAARFSSARHESPWARVKRMVLGRTATAIEEN